MDASETDPTGALELAERLSRAIEVGDLDTVRSLYADDIVVWANWDGREAGIEKSMRLLGWLCQSLGDRRYDVSRRIAIEGGYLQEHVLRGTAPNGETIAMPACLVVTVRDGKITRINEYLDPSHVAALAG